MGESNQPRFSLSWEAHKNNVCTGLSDLQQNGEFVDMTLAADGHFVKVHKVIIALASPYIRDIMNSTPCKHPVVFLNNMSYKTLSSILEYIYTGEVLVAESDVNSLIIAGRELHIKGFSDMSLSPEDVSRLKTEQNKELESTEQTLDESMTDSYEDIYFEVTECDHSKRIYGIDSKSDVVISDIAEDSHSKIVCEQTEDVNSENMITDETCSISTSGNIGDLNLCHYTLSNRGSLQLIVNRFLYYLKHTNRDNTRQWRCTDYLQSNIKCPALIMSKGNRIVKRINAHVHACHDARILKKLQSGAVFTAISEAQQEVAKIRDVAKSAQVLTAVE